MKILIVKLGAIGDIVHALPALHAVRHALPDAEIGWVAEKRSAEILRGNVFIDNLIEVDTRSLRSGMAAQQILPEVSRQVRDLRKFGFDIAVDLQGLLKSAMIAKLSGAKNRFGFSKEDLREPASRIFYNRTVKIPKKIHVIRKNLKLVEQALNIPVPDTDFEFPIFTDDKVRLEASQITAEAGGDFVILNPAGGWVTKLWHAEKFGELADMIWEEHGLVSLIATGPDEAELAGRILQNSRPGRAFAIQPTLKGFFELSKLAKAYIGGDTGPTHLAIAAGTPVVGIFGPTEWWRNGSTNPDDICVERLDTGCRVDCHRRTCSNWICMDIKAETVFSAVSRRLGKI
ncbi:MAG: lipopolysaccharide heptosyltransferase I [Saprospiraceae bacterium]|nr:lipopolysaccharide heptosyltransferase I [Pyrinomonadaceae bacterium]